MRLDKFLKVSRLVKRRTVANELCDGGSVLIDGKVAKAASTVQAGQVLTLRFGNRTLEARITEVPTKVVSVQQAETLYTLLSAVTPTNIDSPL